MAQENKPYSSQAKAPEARMPEAQKSNKVVIIGCKLPNGIRLTVPTPRGDEHVVLKGCAHYIQPAAGRKFINPDLVHGDSLTMVQEDFWEAWKALNKTFAPFVKGMIYEAKDRSEATDIAAELRDVKSGMEQLDPTKFGVKKLEMDDQFLG